VLLGTNCVDAAARPSSVLAIEEWPDAIMYVKLNGFYDMGTTSVTARLRKWITNDVAGVIIDLRGAGGDNLAAADALVGDIVETDATLYDIRNGLDDVVETHRSTQGPKVRDMPPLMLLTDKETHGASETFAAVCATRDGLMLVGSPTRGDAGLREYFTLSESKALYIATRWIVPSGGERYDGTGVQPHIEVEPEPYTPAFADASAGIKAEAISERDVDGDSLQSGVHNPVQKPSSESLEEGKGHAVLDTSDRQIMDPVRARARDILLGLEALRKK